MEKEKHLKASLALILSSGDAVKIGDIKSRITDDGQRVDLDQVRNKLSFSAQLSRRDANNLREEIAPLLKAEEMADQLRSMQRLWNNKIKYMDRRTRRVYTRQFWAKIELFEMFCNKYGINSNIQVYERTQI